MHRLFRFDLVHRRDPAVERWLDAHTDALGELAGRWFEVLRESGDDVREVLHDDQPTACVEDVAFAYVDAYTAHLSVGFFHGAALPDPAGLLEGKGKFMRHVKLRPDEDVDEEALRTLIAAAYADLRERLVAE